MSQNENRDPLLSRAEIAGFVIGVVIIAIMALIVFTGPFHNINKTAAKSIPTLRVSIVNNKQTIGKYTPTTVTIHVGQRVVFTNNASVDHTVTAQDDSFDSKNIAPGQTWTFTPSSVGTFSYICTYHPFMHGAIVVLG